MILIPGPCGEPVLPEECQDGAFQLADCLVQAGVDAIAAFLPDEGECDPFVAFVAFEQTAQPADVCNQLTVLIQKIGRVPQKPNCVGRWRVPMLLQAWFAVYPAPEPIEGGFILPSPEDQEAANRWLYAVGVALYGGITDFLTGELTCDGFRFGVESIGDMTPLGPKGYCAGWSLIVNATV